MQSLHDRMPVFLADELATEWIDPNVTGDHALVRAVSAAAVPLADDLFEYPVASLRGDGPELIQAVTT